MKNGVVIVSACRTPIGALMGSLSSLNAGKLAAAAVKGALERAGIRPDRVDEVFIGSVLQAGTGQNLARQAAIGAGIPVGTTATTLNMVCGSGMKSIITGIQTILCGDNDIVVAGGTESMSNAPYYCKAMRAGNKMGDVPLVDGIVSDGLTDAFHNSHMGALTETLADRYAITREMQDQFAAESQRKAAAAMNAGLFSREIVPVVITDGKGAQTVVTLDEHPRPGTTAEKLAKLRPAFRKDGTITAGNASGINDGAAAVVLMSAEKARSLGIRPMAGIISYAVAGVEPENMGIGPVLAVNRALAKAGLSLDDMDLIESNEAFAAQSIAVMKELGLPEAKVNVNGGAIALGHPIGASGARILVTLLYEMQRRKLGKGLAALCIGGGMGSCIVVEMEAGDEVKR
jgi:acetyl-CoA C-acetyltransferase